MIEQSFSIHHLEYYLAILVRVLGAVAYAPIFGNATVTRRARLILGLAISYAMVTANPYIPLEYTSFIGYTVILLRELMVGLTLGFTTSIALTIINMAGQFIDREIGFSMVSNFDMTFNTETTITAEFYSMSVMLIMLCTNMHYFILSALSDSFEMIPVGQVVIDTGALYDTMVEYIGWLFYDCNSNCSSGYDIDYVVEYGIRHFSKNSTPDEYVCNWSSVKDFCRFCCYVCDTCFSTQYH